MNVEIENVFWDEANGIVMLSGNESELSPTTGAEMKNIGFVEKSDAEKPEMVKFLVDSAKGINTSKITKEVSPMTDEVNETVAETVEEVAVEAEVAPEADVEVAEEVTEEVAAEEVVADEEVAEKADSVSKSDDVLVDAVAEIKDTVTKAFSDLTAVVQAQAEQIAQLSKSIDSVKNEVTETKGEFNEFGKRVDAVVADTAFRKSGDLGEIVQENQSDKIEKSLWDGRFLKTADLFK